MFEDKLKELEVQSIAFFEEHVQINYFEKRHQSDKGGIEQIMVRSNKDITGFLEEIKNAIEEIVEDFQIELRSPPESIEPRKLPSLKDAK